MIYYTGTKQKRRNHLVGLMKQYFLYYIIFREGIPIESSGEYICIPGNIERAVWPQ